MKVRWCPCWFHHRPTVRGRHTPSTSGRRCQEWRRCADIQQTPCRSHKQRTRNSKSHRLSRCPLRSRNPRCRFRRLQRVRFVQFRVCFHRRPTVLHSRIPNTSCHRCQGWRRCGTLQHPPQQPFGPYRDQSLWMKVRWCWCCFHHRPTVRSCPLPNTSRHRCQG